MTRLPDLDTPSALIDLPCMGRNIARMQNRMNALGVAFRPHVKTSKCLPVVQAQLDAGARGITVSTLKEAEQFFAAGVADVLYAVCMVPGKLSQALALRRRGCDLKLITDSVAGAEAIAALRQGARRGLRGLDRDRRRRPSLGRAAGKRDAARGGPRAARGRDASRRRDGPCRRQLRARHADALRKMAEQERSGTRARRRAPAPGRPAVPARERGLDADRAVGGRPRKASPRSAPASMSSSTWSCTTSACAAPKRSRSRCSRRSSVIRPRRAGRSSTPAGWR